MFGGVSTFKGHTPPPALRAVGHQRPEASTSQIHMHVVKAKKLCESPKWLQNLVLGFRALNMLSSNCTDVALLYVTQK